MVHGLRLLGWLRPLPRGLGWYRHHLLLARMRIDLCVVSSRPFFRRLYEFPFRWDFCAMDFREVCQVGVGR